jgi:hypothetical protein
MGVVYSSNIPGVTRNLILYLDPAKRESYSGSGNNWKDLTFNNDNSVLVNSVVHSGFTKDSSMIMDSTDDFVLIPQSLESKLNGIPSATLSMWIKLNSGRNSAGNSGIINLTGHTNTNGNLYFYTDSARVGGIWLNIFRTNRVFTGDWQPTFDGSNWHMLTVTTTPGTNGWKMYLNGILRFQTAGQNTVSANYSLFDGFTLGRNHTRRIRGRISTVYVYNTDLSSDEVLQNYNATKSRYGL